MLEQFFLPVCLALMMLSLGLRLQVVDFTALLRRPGVVLLGLIAQFTLMPMLAVLIATGLGLTGTVALGLLLVSLAPGGATSNVITALCRGDTALSVSLTALSSLLVPFTLPLIWDLFAPAFKQHSVAIDLPYMTVLVPLLIVTLLPLVVGMAVRAGFPTWVNARAGLFARLMGGLFVLLVIAMALRHADVLLAMWPQTGAAVLLLSCAGILGGALLGRLFAQSAAVCTTLAVEVGIQNAGTAMLVGGTLLAMPQLAMVALCYGVLMNLPVAALYLWRRSTVKP